MASSILAVRHAPADQLHSATSTSTPAGPAPAARRWGAINRVPIAILRWIVGYLGDAEDLLSVTSTCKAMMLSAMWAPLQFKMEDRITNWPRAMQVVAKRFHRMLRLDLRVTNVRDCWLREFCFRSDEDGSEQPRFSLHDVTLWRCFNISCAAAATVLAVPGLRSATLSHIHEIPASAFEGASKLKLLSLTNCQQRDSDLTLGHLTAMPSLEVLFLGGLTMSDEDAFFRLLPTNDANEEADEDEDDEPTATALKVVEMTFFSQAHKDAVKSQLPHVQVIDWQEPEAALEVLAGYCEGVPSHEATSLRRMLPLTAACRNLFRRTPLHEAAKAGEEGTVRKLLELCVDLDGKDTKGRTALFHAAFEKHTGCAQQLLAAGANCWLQNQALERPLFIAALKGHEEMVELLAQHEALLRVKLGGAGLEQRRRETTCDGWSPLTASCVQGNVRIVNMMLQAGYGPNDVNRYRQTPLHTACFFGKVEAVKALIAAGADLSIRDCRHCTPRQVITRNKAEVLAAMKPAEAAAKAAANNRRKAKQQRQQQQARRGQGFIGPMQQGADAVQAAAGSGSGSGSGSSHAKRRRGGRRRGRGKAKKGGARQQQQGARGARGAGRGQAAAAAATPRA